ncbi:HdeD family acid-resistance protein [Candidatus Dependentiae bacterium]|nr:HdeD family acid-resistance protein [Candidatus Dependentiae bacterium]
MNSAFNNPLCSLWSSFLTMGIFLVLLGSLAITGAFITTLATVFFLGLILTAGGLSYIVHAFWTPEWKGLFSQLFVGILSVISGWLMLTNPQIGAASITFLLALFFLASGLFKITTALLVESDHRGWLLFNGLITLILGILIFVQWPASSLWIIGMFIGIDLIFGGWANIMYALSLKKRCSLGVQGVQ